MLTHRQIWAAVDALAERHNLSVSALAKSAGLDPTTFNRSKRETRNGRQRWPGTESIAKILSATDATLEEFAQMARSPTHDDHLYTQPIPVIGFAQAGGGGFFDDGGFPVGGGWDHVRFPEVGDENAYALEVSGDSMLPLYREGDTLIVSPNADIRRGDRVVARTTEGEVLAKLMTRRTATLVELTSLNPDFPIIELPIDKLDWIARIVWASQ